MMDWTDRHCRAFHRVLSKRALLWTEMVTADAVIHGDRQRLIDRLHLGFGAQRLALALKAGSVSRAAGRQKRNRAQRNDLAN